MAGAESSPLITSRADLIEAMARGAKPKNHRVVFYEVDIFGLPWRARGDAFFARLDQNMFIGHRSVILCMFTVMRVVLSILEKANGGINFSNADILLVLDFLPERFKNIFGFYDIGGTARKRQLVAPVGDGNTKFLFKMGKMGVVLAKKKRD